MRVIIQRVLESSVTIGGTIQESIGHGLLILWAGEEADNEEDSDWLSGKIARLRIFNDDEGLMNKSILDVAGDVLVVSQFTLFASTKKGNRPSYIRSAKPDIAVPLYEKFIARLSQELPRPVKTGEFGADMQVHLINDGPVTIAIDTKQRE